MQNENGGEPNLYANVDVIPEIGTNESKPWREYTKIGSYMTTILVQNIPK